MIWFFLACASTAPTTADLTTTGRYTDSSDGGAIASSEDTGADGLDTGQSADDTYPYQRLSTYGFFTGELADLNPAPGVLPYDVRAWLWSDGAGKNRFFVLPDGEQATWTERDDLDLPEGTVVIKDFWFPLDRRETDGARQHVETRLLVRTDDTWVPQVYVWNEEQTEAVRDVAGSRVKLSTIDEEGAIFHQTYVIPNQNQCESCHSRDDEMHLLGPDTRQLDMTVEQDGAGVNQLDWLAAQGFFDAELPTEREAFVDPFGDAPVDERVAAYLHANCSHCHRLGGSAEPSGLILQAEEQDLSKRGICKTSVAAGAGTGGLTYDVNPGQPDDSIIIFRMDSVDPEIKMPELPNLLVDEQGVALVREWISSLEGTCAVR